MSNEPKALRFDSAPAAPAPKTAPASSREPGAVIFGAAPAAPAVVAPKRATSLDNSGPSALSFGPAEAPIPAPQRISPPPPAPPANVGRIEFGAAPIAAPAPGRPAFGGVPHPMKVAAQQAARELEAEFYASDTERVDRFMDGLLPFRQEAVEAWGAHTLEDCRAEALKSAALTRRFTDLRSAEQLKDIVESLAPKKGLLGKVRESLGPSLAQREATVKHLKSELETLLREVRAVQPNAAAEGRRLAALVLSLRAVSQACGTPSSSAFELVLGQRLGTLRAALTQASMVPLQLKSVEDTAALELAQCDRLLTVTFTAVAMASAGR